MCAVAMPRGTRVVMRNEKPTIRIPRETLAECAAFHRAKLIEQ